MSALWLGIEFAFCLIDTILLYLFCSMTLGKKADLLWYHFLVGSLIETVLTFMATYISIFSVWKSFLSIILILLYIFILFNQELKKKILCLSMFFIVYMAAEIITMIFVAIVNNAISWEIFDVSGSQRIAFYSISRIIIVLVGSIIMILVTDIGFSLLLSSHKT